MPIYRDIYEQHFGQIPKDIDGRTYEIHHIDGNRKNNSISNLVALSIQEHYDIHYRQNDWNACLAISMRMEKSPGEISSIQSEVGRKSALERKEKGTNPFCCTGEKHPRYGKKHTKETIDKIKKKRSTQVIPEEAYNRASKAKTGQKRTMEMKLRLSLAQKDYQTKSLCVCPHCGKQGPKPSMVRWHFDNCKDNT